MAKPQWELQAAPLQKLQSAHGLFFYRERSEVTRLIIRFVETHRAILQLLYSCPHTSLNGN
jgi:hypothetical protein